jgi:hypothetical protein
MEASIDYGTQWAVFEPNEEPPSLSLRSGRTWSSCVASKCAAKPHVHTESGLERQISSPAERPGLVPQLVFKTSTAS